MEKYYIIHTEDVENPREHPKRYVSISNYVGYTNRSHEPLVKGWLGTTNGIRRDACGEYDTLEDARAYVYKTWENVEEMEREDVPLSFEDDIATFVYTEKDDTYEE